MAETTAASDILQLREHLFHSVAQQRNLDTKTLDAYKDQVTDLRHSFEVFQKEEGDVLLQASQKISQLELGLASAREAARKARGASQDNEEELESRVHFYQQSIVQANRQFEELKAESSQVIVDVKNQAQEKVERAMARASETKQKYTTRLMDAKTEQRRHQQTLEQNLRKKESAVKQQYYEQVQAMSLQKLRDIYEAPPASRLEHRNVDDNTLHDERRGELTRMTSHGMTPLPTTRTSSSRSPSNYHNPVASRLSHIAVHKEVARLQEELIVLRCNHENETALKNQLKEEIMMLQEKLMEATRETRNVETLRQEKETQEEINSHLRARVAAMQEEIELTNQAQRQLTTKDRKIVMLENMLKQAEMKASVEKEKGYEEALSSMESEMKSLQEQVACNRETIASEFQGIILNLQEQRDHFETELIAAQKLIRQQPEVLRSGKALNQALTSADAVVQSVQEQNSWFREKRVLEKRLEILLCQEQERENAVESEILQAKEKESHLIDSLKKLKGELNDKSSRLTSAEERCHTLQQTLLEKFAESKNTGGGGEKTLELKKEEEEKVEQEEEEEEEQEEEEEEEEESGSNQRTDVRELIRALAATKNELYASRAGLSEAKQHVSDLTWQNTSLRHDAFMNRSASTLLTTEERTRSTMHTNDERGGEERTDAIKRPSTLKEYVTNTRTLTQVLSNTTPLRHRLEASTAAFQRRSQRLERSNHSNNSKTNSRTNSRINGRTSSRINRGGSNSRSNSSPRSKFYGDGESNRPNILTPMHKSELYEVSSDRKPSRMRNSPTQNGSVSRGELILDMDLSRALNPLGYHEHHILESDV